MATNNKDKVRDIIAIYRLLDATAKFTLLKIVCLLAIFPKNMGYLLFILLKVLIHI